MIENKNPPNRHLGVIKSSRLCEIVPGARIGGRTKDTLEEMVRLIWLKAVDRARQNGRTTVYPHDL